MNVAIPSAHLSELEQVARPLLQLVQHISGMETSFITAIDWDHQQQDVLFSLNTGAMQLPEGSRIDWVDSMCRSMFLSGQAQSSAVGVSVPATPGATALGVTSFFALPLLAGDSPIGTLCGASRSAVVLSDEKIVSMQLIADSLQHLLQAEVARRQAVARAEHAERDALDAHSRAGFHARDARHMEQLAHTDELTGLPNRRAFTSRWEDALARSGRGNFQIGLLLIDVDQFKLVNDTLGHAKGDAVLQALGASLQAVASSADLMARLGGDEFAVAISHADGDGLLALAETIRSDFARAALALDVDTTLSIGIASSDTCLRHQLLATADKALYQSKAGGGDGARLGTAPLCLAN